jgi:hypothetical protein
LKLVLQSVDVPVRVALPEALQHVAQLGIGKQLGDWRGEGEVPGGPLDERLHPEVGRQEAIDRGHGADGAFIPAQRQQDVRPEIGVV